MDYLAPILSNTELPMPLAQIIAAYIEQLVVHSYSRIFAFSPEAGYALPNYSTQNSPGLVKISKGGKETTIIPFATLNQLPYADADYSDRGSEYNFHALANSPNVTYAKYPARCCYMSIDGNNLLFLLERELGIKSNNLPSTISYHHAAVWVDIRTNCIVRHGRIPWKNVDHTGPLFIRNGQMVVAVIDRDLQTHYMEVDSQKMIGEPIAVFRSSTRGQQIIIVNLQGIYAYNLDLVPQWGIEMSHLTIGLVAVHSLGEEIYLVYRRSIVRYRRGEGGGETILTTESEANIHQSAQQGRQIYYALRSSSGKDAVYCCEV